MANSTRATLPLSRLQFYALLLGLLLSNVGHAFTHLDEAVGQAAPSALQLVRKEQASYSPLGKTQTCSGCESLRHLRLAATASAAHLIKSFLSAAQWQPAVAVLYQQLSPPSDRAPPHA